MRKCSVCKEEKELNEFPKDRSQTLGHSYSCKRCKSEIRKEQRKKDPEKYREQNRKSLERNYEKIRASQKAHRERNKDTILPERRRKRAERKEELNAKERERRKNDPILYPARSLMYIIRLERRYIDFHRRYVFHFHSCYILQPLHYSLS